MKRKLLLLLCCTLLAVGGIIAWLTCRPEPTLRFVRFYREPQGRRMATFQIVNDTGSPFATHGYGPTSPFYRYRTRTPAGWKTWSPGWCGSGAGPHTLAPHSVTEIQVAVPRNTPDAPFAVGLYLERGTAADVAARSHSRVARVFLELRYWMDPDHADPEPTWSAVVPQP